MNLNFTPDLKIIDIKKTGIDSRIKQTFTHMEELFQTKFYCPGKSSLKSRIAWIEKKNWSPVLNILLSSLLLNSYLIYIRTCIERNQQKLCLPFVALHVM